MLEKLGFFARNLARDAMTIGHAPTSSLVCSLPEDDPPAGGDGGGGGSGKLDQGAIDAINAAVKSHMDRLPLGQLVNESLKNAIPNIVEQIQAQVGGQISQIAEKLDGLKAPPKDESGGQGGGSGLSEEVANQLAAFQAKIDELDQANRQKDEALKAQTSKFLADKRRGAVRQALSAAGVKPAMIEPLVTHFDTQGLVKGERPEEFHVEAKREAHGHSYTDKLSLDKWAEEWTKGDGREYLPAQKVGGAGSERDQPGARMGRGYGGVQVPMTKEGQVDVQATDESLGNMLLELAAGNVIDDA